MFLWCLIFSGQKPSLNEGWGFMKNQDVISMPDKWEFPWVSTQAQLKLSFLNIIYVAQGHPKQSAASFVCKGRTYRL